MNPPGYNWRVRYRYQDEPEEIMTVFGRIRAEDALAEARSLLDATPDFTENRITDSNVGTYEILAVERIA